LRAVASGAGAFSYYDDFPCGLKPGHRLGRVSCNRCWMRLDAGGGAGFVRAEPGEGCAGARFQVDILPEGASIQVT
jgi:hypothetical protein